MVTFILILLLLAAGFGVLGIVLKATLVIVLSVVLTVALLTAGVSYWLRYRLYRFRRELERRGWGG
ncbi:MAG TPA: hypothetical protein VE646_03890 [Actinomycetota bacterium]|nr:hypothetical protein [Actinomycetota bacterium]